jgi:hypothetical protein
MISNIQNKNAYEGAGGDYGTQRLLAAAGAPKIIPHPRAFINRKINKK